MQFHIETTPEMVAAWAAEDTELLEGYDLDRTLSRVAATDADLVEVWQPFTHAFADIVRDPAAVAAGRRRPQLERGAPHRPGRDPGRARRRGAGRAHAVAADADLPSAWR